MRCMASSTLRRVPCAKRAIRMVPAAQARTRAVAQRAPRGRTHIRCMRRLVQRHLVQPQNLPARAVTAKANLRAPQRVAAKHAVYDLLIQDSERVYVDAAPLEQQRGDRVLNDAALSAVIIQRLCLRRACGQQGYGRQPGPRAAHAAAPYAPLRARG